MSIMYKRISRCIQVHIVNKYIGLGDIISNYTTLKRFERPFNRNMYQNEELCILAMEAYYSLYHVINQTPDICMMAVTQDGGNLKYVRDDFKTPELCLAAVKNFGWALELVPAEFQTEEMCEIAVRNNGLTLQFVRKDLMSEYLCYNAVVSDVDSLCCVPSDFQTLDILKLVDHYAR